MAALKLMARYSADGSLHYIFMDWRHQLELLTAVCEVYSETKNMCVWVKDNAGLGTFYRSQHELVFVFKKGKTPYRNNIELGRHGRNRTNVWHYPSLNNFGRRGEEGNLAALHPTVKPINLVADAILDFSARGDVVLDPFLGSGSTLIAAQRTGRICDRNSKTILPVATLRTCLTPARRKGPGEHYSRIRRSDPALPASNSGSAQRLVQPPLTKASEEATE